MGNSEVPRFPLVQAMYVGNRPEILFENTELYQNIQRFWVSSSRFPLPWAIYIFFKVESTNFEVTSTSFYAVIQVQLSLSFWNMWRKQLREQCLQLVKVHQLLDWQHMFRGIRSLKNGRLRLVHWCWLIKASVWLMSLIKYVHFFLSTNFYF